MKFRAFLIEMAESEIMAMIPTSEYMRIKLMDPKPLFRAYVIGHEGESRGSVAVGGRSLGNVVKKWYQSAIRKLHDKIQLGLDLFHGHGDSDSYDGRNSIGQVVGKALKDIQDRLSVVVAAWIKPEFRNLPLDVASIEAMIFLKDSNGSYEADVESVSGIALGSSQTETPGFAGATLLGQIQAFAEEKSQFSKINFQGGNVDKITISDVRTFIKAENVKPSDIFSLADLTDDSTIQGFVEQEKKKAGMGEYVHRERMNEAFDKAREKWENEKAELEKKLKEKDSLIAKSSVGTLFEKMKEKRKLDEKELKFIEKKLAKFEPKEAEKIEDELNAYVDDLVDEFAEIRKDVFEEEAEGGEGGEKEGAKGDKKGAKEEKKESITGPKKKETEAEGEDNPLLP